MRFGGSRRRRGPSETWQVIYIDLMTNVMCFFVILWAISNSKKAKVAESLGDHTSRMVSLPGDVIFSAGSATLSANGQGVFKKLFSDENGSVLSFDSNGLMKRLLVVHGHTDGDGKKDANLTLGFNRALAAYREIARYSKEVPDHVVLCTHADNTPAQEVPEVTGKLTGAQKEALESAKAKNRRITIEDELVTQTQTE